LDLASKNYFLNMAFGQVGGKNEGKDCNHFGAD
jgi:hypothetical protein